MSWYRKDFPNGWAATSVLDDFVQIFMALAGPRHMMLVEQVHTRLHSTLWVWLPEPSLLDVFPGFEKYSSLPIFAGREPDERQLRRSVGLDANLAPRQRADAGEADPCVTFPKSAILLAGNRSDFAALFTPTTRPPA